MFKWSSQDFNTAFCWFSLHYTAFCIGGVANLQTFASAEDMKMKSTGEHAVTGRANHGLLILLGLSLGKVCKDWWNNVKNKSGNISF